MSARWIAFHITDRCQLDCQHCLRDPAQKPKDLPRELIVRVVDEALRLYKTVHVSFTGGEPTLHPEFEAIVRAVVDRGCTWHLVTNGRKAAQLTQFIASCTRRRAQLDQVNISLDGATEETHDAIRGAGSFREVMQAASLCTVHGLPFLLNVTLNASNVQEIEAMGLLAAELGARSIQFGMMTPTGTVHDERLFLPARAWKKVLDRLQRLQAMLKITVRLAEGFPSEQPFHVCESFRGEPFHVDIEGNLNLCCMHAGVPGTRQDVGGNLHSMSLVEAHGGLLDVIHQAQKDRLAHIAQGKLDAWDSFPCNACLKQFGKPHWSDAGAVGPSAARQRWTGAWSLEHQLQRGLPESGQGARAGAGAGAGASAGRLDLDPRQGAPRRLPLV